MSETPDEDLVIEAPEGEDVGDIASGHGNPAAHHHVSDEKAEAMLAAREAQARTVADLPGDAPGGSGASSW